MRKEVTVDMTTGSIGPQILRFAMPVLLGLIFQRIYNFAAPLSERYMEAQAGPDGDGAGHLNCGMKRPVGLRKY